MKPKTTITVTVRCEATQTPELEKTLVTLIANLSLEDLKLLAKASSKPVLKSMALNELRKHV